MKKLCFRFALSLLIVLPCVLGITACSESEDVQLEVSGELEDGAILSEIEGKFEILRIHTNGSWTIDIPEDASHWVYIAKKSGHGDSNIPVSIDANFGSAEGRSTTITITSGDVIHKIPVLQHPTYNGEAVPNDDAQHLLIAATKGIGLGINLNTLTTSNNRVIDLNAIKDLQELNSNRYKSLFTYNSWNSASAAGAIIDSVDTKKDSLGVALSFDINYGDFKMNIGGAYHGDETKSHYQTEYKYGATYNIASASADIASLVAYYNKASVSNDNSDETEYMQYLLTAGFIDAKTELEEIFQSEDSDSDDIDEAIASLVKKFGPAVVSGCNLGGSISLWMKYNKDSISEKLHIDTAHVKLAVETGLLSIGANVEVSYSKDGTKVLENSHFKFNIAGGAKAPQDSVAIILSSPRQKGDEGKVYSSLQDNIKKWIGSIDAEKPETLTQTKIEIYPIWYFFKGSKLRKAIKNWIIANYEDKIDVINNAAFDINVDDN